MKSIEDLLPNRYLGGNGIGRNPLSLIECNPNTSMLYFGAPLTRIQELAADDQSDSCKNLKARMSHEYDHLFRHWSTSYGFVQDHLAAWSGINLRFAFTTIRPGREGYVFPLLNDLKSRNVIDEITRIHMKAPSFFEEVKRFGDFYAGSDEHTKQLLHYLGYESLSKALKDSVPLEAFCLPFHTLALLDTRVFHPGSGMRLTAWLPQFELDWFEGSSPWISQLARDSLVIGDPRQLHLSATHLMEFLAVIHEIGSCEVSIPSWPSWLELIEAKNDQPFWVLKATDQYQYQLVLDYWRNAFSEGSFFADETSIWFAIPMELYAAVDLALWIPIGPSGFLSERGQITWLDIHPGWRFIKIVHLLKEWATEFSRHPKDLDERNRRFRIIQDELCCALGWPTVDEIADKWAAFLQARIESGGFDPYFSESAEHPRLRVSRDLLRARSKAPYQLALDPEFFGRHINAGPGRNFPFAGRFFVEEGKLCLVGIPEVGSGSSWFSLHKFYLIEIANYLMQGDSRHRPISCYDTGILERSVDYMNDFFDHGDGWSKELFAKEARAFFRC